MRKSCFYFPENGSEYTTPDGKTWLCCAHCMFPYFIFFYHILAVRFLLWIFLTSRQWGKLEWLLINSGGFFGMKHVSPGRRGRRGKRSLAVGRRATFEKDLTRSLNAVHRHPPPSSPRTDGLPRWEHCLQRTASFLGCHPKYDNIIIKIEFYPMLEAEHPNLPLQVSSPLGGAGILRDF